MPVPRISAAACHPAVSNGLNHGFYTRPSSEKGRMKKGVLFTVLTLFLILNLYALSRVSSELKSADASVFSELNALATADSKLKSIINNAAFYDGFGSADSTRQRVLPMQFTADLNSVVFYQKLPASNAVVSGFFDSINAFEIFMEDSSYSNIYDGISVDINTIKNSSWGGSADVISLQLLPQCFAYELEGLDTISIKQSCAAFNVDALKKIDMNVLVENSEDFNSVACDFPGKTACPNEAFNPASPLPYLQLRILDENCSMCNIPDENTTVSAHFDPQQSNSVLISCVGSCTSSPIALSLSTSVQLQKTGTQNNFSIGLDFNESISEIRFRDFNASVTNPPYNITVRST